MFKLAIYCLSAAALVLAKPQKDVKTVYVFGDSYSDSGNQNNLTHPAAPLDPKSYYKGRFSNGRVWVEYLAEILDAKLVNYAYGGATSNSDQFPGSSKTYTPPGCIQQVNKFIKEVDQSKVDPDTSLAIMAFFGNDFFTPESTAADFLNNINQCATILFQKTKLNQLLLPRGVAIELSPIFKALPEVLSKRVKSKSDSVANLFDAEVKYLTKINPGLTVHKLDIPDVMREVAKGKVPMTKNQKTPPVANLPCLNPKKEATNGAEGGRCENPDSMMFWDAIHPTTTLHKVFAEKAFEKLTDDFEDELEYDHDKY